MNGHDLHRVDELLMVYEGRDDALFDHLERTYGVVPVRPGLLGGVFSRAGGALTMKKSKVTALMFTNVYMRARFM